MEIRRVAVIGSGQMGTGMAQVTARAGFETVLMKMTEGPVDAGKQKIAKALQHRASSLTSVSRAAGPFVFPYPSSFVLRIPSLRYPASAPLNCRRRTTFGQ